MSKRPSTSHVAQRHRATDRRFFVGVIGVLLVCLATAGAYAGPLRDWLDERRGSEDDQLQRVDAGALPSDIQITNDVPYGEHARHRFDVYAPHGVHDAPVVFMVHGGGWRRGDKAHDRVVENKVKRWLPRGFVFVSTNYRLVPDADPVRQATDVARALAAFQRRAAEFGADPRKVILIGHSAGAHLVALLTADPSLAAQQGVSPWLGAVLLDSAALNVPDTMRAPPRIMRKVYKNAFGDDPNYWRKASPYHALVAKGPPVLAVCSSQRRDDPCGAADSFVARMHALGRRGQVLPQPMSHREINEQLGLPGSYTTAVEAFMASIDSLVAARLRH
ncbi:alpha/beta hydrolase [Thiosocius teredinicola]|uniref:alpha/beta hydrolase n=1 Tax=Thiosocius teredinicola TaxID=1973002 RepID=UPI000990CBF2